MINTLRRIYKLFFVSVLVEVFSLVVFASPTPSADSGKIGILVGQIFSREHYSKQPFDDSISQKFLKIYLDTLDYNHLMFLDSDIQEFQRKYGTILDDETLGGNVQPGFDIFDRYIRRVEQDVSIIQKIIKEDFSFDTDESIVLDRKDAPWPANEEQSLKIWHQRIKYEILQEKLANKKIPQARDTVSKRYNRLLKMYHEEDAESVLQFYLSSLALAYDPHSEYLSPTKLDDFAVNMKLSLVGIGAILNSEDGYAKIAGIVPGGPADLDKRLKVRDRITAVAQGDGPFVDIVDMKLSKAVEMIRGKKNTEVQLQVIPAEASDPSTRVLIKLVRDEIKITEAEAKAKLIEHKDFHDNIQRLGYIELPSFYSDNNAGIDSKSTTRDVASLIEKLKSQNIHGLILDLRRNGGGALNEAITLTGLFIKDGPIVQIKDSRGQIRVLNDDDPSMIYDGPMIVLVNHISASASEILAAALQDYGRAIIVGEKSTFGKGTVQKMEELGRYLPLKGRSSSSGAVKLTIQKFYRISGGSTQYRGVIPDIQLPSELDYLKINEASLENPLPYDEVAPTQYVPVAVVTPFLFELCKRSQNRVSTDPEFKYIQEDIARLKNHLEEKNLSLNEAKRLQEKKADEDRIEKRKAERVARKLPIIQMTEITLESLKGTTSHAAALTQKVIEDANKVLEESDRPRVPRSLEGRNDHRSASEDKSGSVLQDSKIDPELSEGINILTDLVDLYPKPIADR